jgi:penicillin-binding protein 2
MLGVVALGVFAVLFLRLWALQVISGSQYLQAAQNNQLRTVRVEAPRGPILDRYGRVLVRNRAGTSVEIWPSDLPKTWPARRAELRRLSLIVGVPVRQILRDIERRKDDPLTPVTVKEGVPEAKVMYLSEHKNEFPGVDIAQTYLRSYPHGSLAAHVLGYVGEISKEQLKRDRKRSYHLGDKIGQAGVESAFDLYLRGKPGLARRRVDSLGRPRSDLVLSNQSRPGYALRLTIDLDLQRAAEKALAYGISLAQSEGEWAADGGAIVALDPNDGSVLAMASNPTYNPNVYAGRGSPRDLAPLVDDRAAKEANSPGIDRAIAGVYPPGSTFKPVTGLAAMEEHLVSPYESLACTGSYTAYKQRFNNWDPFVSAQMTMPTALAASCDTYFYQLGNKFWSLPPERGHPLQAWAARFGFGQHTGIDIGPESTGLLPTPEWRQATFKTELDRSWKPGHSIQLAIGQGDISVTPLQMTRFYAMLANGGRLVTPHVAQDVEQPGDNRSPAVVRLRFTPAPPLKTNVDPAALAVVRDGLFGATHLSFGTSTAIFGSFPEPIAGKTGTAEKVIQVPGFFGMKDQSWWCGYGPASDPTIVVCALIENGGHGGTAAAPAALKVFEQYFHTPAVSIGQIYSD